MDVVKSYIESQRTDEHQRKYDKKSDYWDKISKKNQLARYKALYSTP